MKFFYFIAQTGCLSDTPLNSNFYTYTIPEQHRRLIEDAVEHATVGAASLEYPRKFLTLLNALDRRAGNANLTRL